MMFVVKVDGVSKSVHNTYDAAVGAAEVFRNRGRTITVTAFADDEFAAILQQLNDREPIGSGFAKAPRLWASASGAFE
jgi:hypothetical protein